MNKEKVKRIISFLLILIGAILLIIEIASSHKNYYMQSVGIISLMTGVFLVNTSVTSKSQENDVEHPHTKEEE
ncbi:hypothetical protein [Aquimarina sp. SS2-1]|uniref:hypothetical protein n=1 Tax=Aquimarina besae TaxID=3342247 RepID=UPI0036705FD7